MEYIQNISINEAVIHVLDNNTDEPILNEYRLDLNEEVYEFLLKHIQKCLKSEELKYGIFNEGQNIVKDLSQEYLNGQNDLVYISKRMAKELFNLMKKNEDTYSCDLIIVSISTEYGPLLGVLKMDYIKNYTHKIDFVDNKIGISIVPQFTGLPISYQKIQKGAFIKIISEKQKFHVMFINKKNRSKQKESNYFIDEYLKCNIIKNERDMTKGFLKATENWTRENFEKDADSAEFLRSTVKKKLKNEDSIDIKDFSQEMFEDKPDKKESFMEYVSSQGIDNKINVDKQWVEKKLKRIRLKIDKDIDLYINEDAYSDKQRFEIERVGDGSINIVIKHINNYIEK